MKKNSRNITKSVVVLLSLSISVFGANNVFAGGIWSNGSTGESTGNSSDWAVGTGGRSWFHTTVVAWYEYEYDKGYQGEAYIPAFNRGNMKNPGVTIPADCTKNSTKFYSSGPVGYKVTNNSKDSSVTTFATSNGNAQQLGVFHRGAGSEYIGAISNSNAISYAYSSDKTISGIGWTNGLGTEGKVATGKIVSYGTANTAWKNALKKQGLTEEELSSSTADGGGYVTSFCAYDLIDDKATQSAVTTLNINYTGKDGSKNKTSTSSDGTPEVTVTSRTIKVWSSYAFTRDKKTDVYMSFNAYFRTPDNSSYGDLEGVSYSANSNKATVNKGTSVAPKVYTLSGDSATLCSATKYPTEITDTETKSATSSSPEAEACIKVKIDPVLSDVESQTTVIANGKSAVTSGWDTNPAMLDLGTAEPTAEAYNKGLAYGVGALNVSWNHKLRIVKQRYRSETNFRNAFDYSAVKVHAKPDSSEVNTTLSARIQEVTPGNTYKTINGWNPLIFTRPRNPPTRYANSSSISEKYNIIPGQKLNSITETIWHDSMVYSDGTPYVANVYEDASSTASVTGVANFAECKLTGNNGSTFVRYIGANGAANDYAGHYVESSKGRVIVGDATGVNSETIWLKGNDTVANLSFHYEACFGEQTAEDAAHTDGSGSVDSFRLNENEEASKLATSNDPYYLLYSSNDDPAINEYTISGHRAVKNPPSKHIYANELGSGGFEGRLNKGYVIKPNSKAIAPSKLLGHSNVSSISKTAGISTNVNATYSITTNIPYNYVLNPQPAISDGLNVVTAGSTISFAGKVQKSGRKNPKVDSTTAYATNTKTTKVKTNVFMLDANETIGSINPSGVYNGQVSTDSGNNYKVFTIQGKDQNATIEDLIGHSVMASEDSQYDISATSYPSPDGLTAGDEVGKKYCFAIGVYPADSHNIGTDEIAEGMDQSVALSGDVAGDNALWRVSVSCRTVAKYPSFSVEGNGVRASGSVKTSRAYIRGRVFGSWVEYGLVSGPGSNVSTGATLAYANINTDINKSGNVGSDDVSCFGIQSVGNNKDGKNCDDAGSSSEAEMVEDEIDRTKDNLSKYKVSSIDGMALRTSGVYSGIKNGVYKIYVVDGADASSVIDYAVNVDAGDYRTVAITYANDAQINSDIVKNTIGQGRQVLIFANSISISNSVGQIDAWLIAENKIDTCKEAEVGDEELGDVCNNSLIINGPVIAGSVSLDRVYGAEAEGSDIGGNIRRGEIFDYDPSSVLWAYKESLKESKTEIRYIKERAVRY